MRGKLFPQAQMPREQRQKRRTKRRANHAQRQLRHAIRVIEVGNRTTHQERCDDHIHRQIDLCDASAQHPRHHAAQHLSDGRCQRRAPIKAQRHPRLPRRNPNHGKLHYARGENAPGQGMAGCGQIRRQADQGRHQQQVEEYRRGGGSGEAVQAVQHAGNQCGQANQRHVEKRDAREFNGQRKFLRRGRKARCQHANHLRHKNQRDQRQQRKPEHHQRAHAFRHVPCCGAAFGGQYAGKGGHKGRVEGAFAKQAAEQIGQFQRHEKRIRHRPRPKAGGD